MQDSELLSIPHVCGDHCTQAFVNFDAHNAAPMEAPLSSFGACFRDLLRKATPNPAVWQCHAASSVLLSCCDNQWYIPAEVVLRAALLPCPRIISQVARVGGGCLKSSPTKSNQFILCG